MNVLVINLVKATFEADSPSRRRLEEYSRLVDKLFVIVWTREKKAPIIVPEKLFIYPTNSKSRLCYIFDSLRLARKIAKKNKINLVFAQDLFETGLGGYLIAKKIKARLGFQIHTDFLSPYFWQESLLNKIRVLLARFLIKKANCLQVVSERIKKSLISKYRNIEISRIVVLPIFVDVKKIQAMPLTTNLHKKYPQFDFVILMASRLSSEKNVGLAIEAMAEIIKKHPKTGLLIVGSGPEEKKLKAKSYKLKANIVFEETLPFEQVISYYKTADLFLLTSNYEGYGMAVVEAMACGLPVVMTDVGLAGEDLEDNKEGIVVPVGDVQKLSQAILSLRENEELRKRFSSAAWERIKNFPGKEEYLNNYKNLLKGCL